MSSQPHQVHIVVDVARGTKESAKGKEKERHSLHRALKLSHLLDLSFFTLSFFLARSCDMSSQLHQVHIVVDVARGTKESAKGKQKDRHNLHRALKLSHLLDLSLFILPFFLARSCDMSSQPHQVHIVVAVARGTRESVKGKGKEES